MEAEKIHLYLIMVFNGNDQVANVKIYKINSEIILNKELIKL